jgi:hypothetical protein
MGKSLTIINNNKYLFIKKNKTEKLVILFFSLFAELFFYFFLFKNIFPATKKEGKAIYAIFLLSLISIFLLVMVFLSLRNFLLDKDYKFEKNDDDILINGRKLFKRHDVKVVTKNYVNRWGTQTYNVVLVGNKQKFKIIWGINKNDMNYLVEELNTFFVH